MRGGREGGGKKEEGEEKGKGGGREKTLKTSRTSSSRLNTSHSDLSQYSAIFWFKKNQLFQAIFELRTTSCVRSSQ